MLFLCMVCVQVPVSAAGKECQICLMDEHDEDLTTALQVAAAAADGDATETVVAQVLCRQ